MSTIDQNQEKVITILRECLSDKIDRNSKYSARAFAKDIRVSPAFISMLLAGKKKLSFQRANEVSLALEMDDQKRTHFLRAVALSSLPKDSSMGRSLEDLLYNRQAHNDVFPVEVDQFKFFSSWYHVAILDLTTTSNFKSEIQDMADRLKISPLTVKDSVERLLRLGLLKNINGRLVKTKKNISVPVNAPDSMIRNFHRQLIEKAKEALDSSSNEDFQKRNITGITMAIDPKKMDEAKKRIAEFKRQMADLLTEKNCTEVYQMNIQFFPLTQASRGKS